MLPTERGIPMRHAWKLAVLLPLALSLAACGRPGAPGPDGSPDARSADAAAIARLRGGYETAVNTHNLQGLEQCWAADGVLMPPDQPAVAGKAQIVAWYKQTFDQLDAKLALRSTETRTGGDWGFDRGTFTLTLTPKGPGSQAAVAGATPGLTESFKYITVVRREGGAWKVARNLWNRDNPPAVVPGAGPDDSDEPLTPPAP